MKLLCYFFFISIVWAQWRSQDCFNTNSILLSQDDRKCVRDEQRFSAVNSSEHIELRANRTKYGDGLREVLNSELQFNVATQQVSRENK